MRVELGDVAATETVARLVGCAGPDAELPPLGGVIHSAGASRDAALTNLDGGQLARALRAKVAGGWRLHRATAGLDLGLFVLFSSLTGVVGNAGQAAYAAANAFLDQLAGHRRSLGLAGQAIAWGPWGEVGAAERGRGWLTPQLARIGFGWLTRSEGIEALDTLAGAHGGMRLAARVDWPAFRGAVRTPQPLLAELAGPGRGVEESPGAPDELRTRLRAASPPERESLLAAFVRDEVQSLLRLVAPPPADVGFFDLGMDSLMAVELRNRLNRGLAGAFAREYTAPDSVVFDHPNVGELARHFAEQLGGAAPDPARADRRIRRRVAIRRAEERIAVVGMACRFPGSTGLAGFWDALAAGADAVTRGRPDELVVDEATADAAPWGGYLEELDRFDAEFFRIAPVEAELMDPQQRLLLETSWEALEDAGLDPGGLAGSRTGVYCGISGSDYRQLLDASGREGATGIYLVTGTSCSTAIGRVAFTLGFQGPAIAVDTACSSSLVAIHQAAAALARGEADLALAGGVNAILSGAPGGLLAAAGMLSPAGRCRTFDAAADGFVRGEGCGVLALKRLVDAERDGDRIAGVLLGSAVNQDGASAGLTVPNGQAQERVIREALERAGVEPSEVEYLEAHGTATELGDPIEVRAAAAVYGEGRAPDRPLLLGSVKTNVGHLEAAAGVAGVVKVLLAMRHGTIPPHLHFETPNPRIDWEALPVRVPAGGTAWPEVEDRPVRAGISSFGISGTNAHLILEGYGEERERRMHRRSSGRDRPPRADDRQSSRPRILPLSARTPQALAELAGRYLTWQDEANPATEHLADAAWTAGTGRSHFAHRAGLVFRDREDLRGQLDRLARETGDRTPPDPPPVAFLYPGQGSGWSGMGRDLYEREPVFREVLDRCEAAFRDERDASLLAVMFGEQEGLDRTEWTQPALFALSAGLTEMWASVGVRPDAAFGHGVGEIAAAWAAGGFALEAGLWFAGRRGSLMAGLPAGGAMAAVFASPDTVAAELRRTNARAKGAGLALAAENGTHVVVSGPRRLIAALGRRLAKRGVRTEELATNHGFHSALVDPVLEELESAGAQLGWAAPAGTFVSGLTGREIGPEEVLDGGYWRRQAREPVRFAAGVAALAARGVGLLVEVGPGAELGRLALLGWPEGEGTESVPSVVTSLGPETAFSEAVSGAYERGVPVSFAGLFAGERRRRVAVPTYPFQRKRYWARAPDAGRGVPSADAVQDLLYEVEWRDAAAEELSPAPPEAGPPTSLWVVAAGAGTLGDGLVREFENRDRRVVLPETGEEWSAGGSLRERWRRFFEGLADGELAGVVYLGAVTGHGTEAAADAVRADVERVAQGALALAQGLQDANAAAGSGLWFVTRGGQVLGEEPPGQVAGAALWGFGRTVSLELGGVPVRLLDLDPASASPAALARELLDPSGEPEVALRGGRRRVPRLVRVRAPAGTPLPAVREDRTYLVTGGLGGIGLAVAGWLLHQGAGALVLNGRRAPDAAAADEVARLREQASRDRGAEVRVEIADVTDSEAVRRLVERAGAEHGLPPLGGVLHSVGVLADAALTNQDWAGFERVLWPKVLGGWRLHEATRSLELDLFVLFSSFSGVVGNPGQANYAAANALLDQLALYRRGLGLPGQAIQWGLWSDVGEAEEARDRIAGRLSARGAGWLTPEQGLRALELLLRADAGAAAAVSMDWEAVGKTGQPLPALLRELVSAGEATEPAELGKRLGGVPAGERAGVLRAFVEEEVRSVLGLDAAPAAETGFFDLGMDSLTAVELRNALNRSLGDAYVAPNTVAFDYPTVERLSRHLAEALGEVPPPAAPAAVRAAAPKERIAVVGMGCRFPGGENPEAFWELLAAGGEGVRRGRPDDLMLRLPGTQEAPWGAYVANLDRFDAEFFRIAPVEADLLDPQQRLLLEVSWEALEDAGLDPGGLRGSRGGVYMGIGSNDYQRFVTDAELNLYSATGTSFATAIGRVAFVLGLEGPALAVDTACSSSLTAIHQAATALRQGEADLALAGGVNAILISGGEEILGGSGVLSPDGRCKTFDARANGYVRGEGCGVLVLKRLSDAERDGDRILGVLLGSAVNQDGASAGLTVPNGPAQERVIRDALRRAGVEPASVDYLEAHGTGTELGDPIEVQAAAAVYGEDRDADHPLLLGSVKTNVGHLEAAAGVAGVMKVLLAMQHGLVPKHLHFETPNPNIEWDSLPVRVTSEAAGWPSADDRPARAGVSSFGISGTNAHVIVEAWGEERRSPEPHRAPQADETETSWPPRLLPLSAHTPEALSELGDRYLAWLDSGERAAGDLADAAWTAAVGRSHFAHRAAVVFRDAAELRAGLAAVVRSGSAPPPAADPGNAAAAAAIAYETGRDVAFPDLFAGERRRRIALPTYPFQRERHWVKVRERRRVEDGLPLLGARRVSASGEVTFETEIAATEPEWLGDHRVFGRAVVPGAFYGAQAVAALSANGRRRAAPVRVEDVHFEHPLVLPEGNGAARRVQFLLGRAKDASLRTWEVFSRESEQEPWVRHAAGKLGPLRSSPRETTEVLGVGEPDRLRASLVEVDGAELYRRLTASGIALGPGFRGVRRLWSGASEALGELALPEGLDANGDGIHPVLLDACFQTLAGVASLQEAGGGFAWLPVGWDALWLDCPAPGRLLCHLRLPEPVGGDGADGASIRRADLAICTAEGAPLGGVQGLRLRSATRSSLLRAADDVEDLLYEVAWRDAAGEGRGGLRSAAFLRMPASRPGPEAPDPTELAELDRDLERLARAYARAALRELGHDGASGGGGGPETVRRRLKVTAEHAALLGRLLGMVREDPETDPDALAGRLEAAHPPAGGEFALLRRCGAALADVLRGRAEARDLLVGEAPGAVDLLRESPLVAAGTRMAAAAAGEAVASLPAERRLRVLELGAGALGAGGTGLETLPGERTEVIRTERSASDLAAAEERLAGSEADAGFRVLDLEREPGEQGFEDHGADLVLAADLPYAARDLGVALTHCLRLLAPAGLLLAPVALAPRGYRDLTFGLLPEAWRFDDVYRTDHALPDASGWARALADAGFAEVKILDAGGAAAAVAGLVVARAPQEVTPRPGLFVVWPEGTPAGGPEPAQLTRALEAAGQRVVVPSDLPASRRQSWREFFASLPPDPPLRGVVHLGGIRDPAAREAETDLPAGVERVGSSALALAQGLQDAGVVAPAGLWFVTRGGQRLDGEEGGPPAASLLWGFARSAARELTAFPVRLLDDDPRRPCPAGVLAGELLHPDRETEVAYRNGRRLVSRLTRLRPPDADAGLSLSPALSDGRLREDRSYLVTGGLGGIGLEVARWLGERGAAAVVLNGRSAPSPQAEAAVAALRQRGTEVRVERGDVADIEAVRGILRGMEAELPPLGGVIHCAGVVSDAALGNLDWDGFERVLRPKALGAWQLHRATLGMELDLFVVFSSVAGLLGSPGQANYAAANAFLDQLALYRRSLGLPGQAIQWGSWSDAGMAEEARDRIEDRLAAAGLGWMTPGQGLRALGRLVRDDVPSAAVVSVDWPAVGAQGGALPVLFAELAGSAARGTDRPAEDLVSRVRDAAPPARERLLLEFVRREAASVLQLPEPPAPDVGFFELGMDSLMAVELRNRVNRGLLGEYVAPASVVFDFPSAAALARHCLDALAVRWREEGIEAGPAADEEDFEGLLTELRGELGDPESGIPEEKGSARESRDPEGRDG